MKTSIATERFGTDMKFEKPLHWADIIRRQVKNTRNSVSRVTQHITTTELLCQKILRISTGEKIQFQQNFPVEKLDEILRNACKNGSRALVICAGKDGELGATLLYYLLRLKEQKYCGNCEIILDAPGILSDDLIPMLLYPHFPITEQAIYKDGFRILKKNEREECFKEDRKREQRRLGSKSREIQEVQIVVAVSDNESLCTSNEYLNRWLDNPYAEFAFIGNQNANPLKKALVEKQQTVAIKESYREVYAKIHHLTDHSD